VTAARIYLDSCILIYALEGEPKLRRAVHSKIELAVAEAEADFCVSDLTRLECRVGPLRQGDDDLLALYDALFASSAVEQLTIAPATFELATELRADHGLKTPDAIHLAAAIMGGCGAFWTNDHQLMTAAKDRIELEVVP
jgi:predicted nucleic acid-binding protein